MSNEFLFKPPLESTLLVALYTIKLQDSKNINGWTLSLENTSGVIRQCGKVPVETALIDSVLVS